MNDSLWVGVQFPDGRRATHAGRNRIPPELDGDAAVLWRSEASSSKVWALLTYYLTPQPPPGPMTVILAWPAFAMGEFTQVIPAGPLAEAAGRVRVLWPVDGTGSGWRG